MRAGPRTGRWQQRCSPPGHRWVWRVVSWGALRTVGGLTVLLPPWAQEAHAVSWMQPPLCFQMPVTFEDVALYLSREEWGRLDHMQQRRSGLALGKGQWGQRGPSPVPPLPGSEHSRTFWVRFAVSLLVRSHVSLPGSSPKWPLPCVEHPEFWCPSAGPLLEVGCSTLVGEKAAAGHALHIPLRAAMETQPPPSLLTPVVHVGTVGFWLMGSIS